MVTDLVKRRNDGDYRTPERAVLTERDYVARYVAQADTRRKLYAIFATHRIVFVGFSLTEKSSSASNTLRCA